MWLARCVEIRYKKTPACLSTKRFHSRYWESKRNGRSKGEGKRGKFPSLSPLPLHSTCLLSSRFSRRTRAETLATQAKIKTPIWEYYSGDKLVGATREYQDSWLWLAVINGYENMRDMACRIIRIWDIWGIWQAGYTDMKDMAGQLDIRIWRYGATIGGIQPTDFMIAGYGWLDIACSRRLNCGGSAKRCEKENRLLVAHSTIWTPEKGSGHTEIG